MTRRERTPPRTAEEAMGEVDQRLQTLHERTAEAAETLEARNARKAGVCTVLTNIVGNQRVKDWLVEVRAISGGVEEEKRLSGIRDRSLPPIDTSIEIDLSGVKNGLSLFVHLDEREHVGLSTTFRSNPVGLWKRSHIDRVPESIRPAALNSVGEEMAEKFPRLTAVRVADGLIAGMDRVETQITTTKDALRRIEGIR